jgi:hypothetical protein
MLKPIARAALWLDNWLQSRLGRPYNALLGVSLIIEVFRHIAELPEKFHLDGHVLGEGFAILFELALLVHQVGALSHRFEARGPGGPGDGRPPLARDPGAGHDGGGFEGAE